VVGSYIFIESAKTRNDENTLVIHSPEKAGLYRQEFERYGRRLNYLHE
jgi:phosphatidylserine/phosphatidylglycerophosphate/cardiolipin synthase-like enzyme